MLLHLVLLKPWMSQDMLKSDPVGRVHKYLLEEILSEGIGTHANRGPVPEPIVESSYLRLSVHFITCVEGSASIEQLIYDHSHAPYVHTVVVRDFVFLETRREHFYRVKLKSAHSCVLAFFLELFFKNCKAKVCYIDTPVEADHDVFWLQISMDDSLLVNL